MACVANGRETIYCPLKGEGVYEGWPGGRGLTVYLSIGGAYVVRLIFARINSAGYLLYGEVSCIKKPLALSDLSDSLRGCQDPLRIPVPEGCAVKKRSRII